MCQPYIESATALPTLHRECYRTLRFLLYNENVDRPANSTHVVEDLRRPDRSTPMKVLTQKVLPLHGEYLGGVH